MRGGSDRGSVGRRRARERAVLEPPRSPHGSTRRALAAAARPAPSTRGSLRWAGRSSQVPEGCPFIGQPPVWTGVLEKQQEAAGSRTNKNGDEHRMEPHLAATRPPLPNSFQEKENVNTLGKEVQLLIRSCIQVCFPSVLG